MQNIYIIIPRQSSTYNMNIVSSTILRFCGMEPETLEHLLLDCKAICRPRNRALGLIYPSKKHVASLAPSRVLEFVRVLHQCDFLWEREEQNRPEVVAHTSIIILFYTILWPMQNSANHSRIIASTGDEPEYTRRIVFGTGSIFLFTHLFCRLGEACSIWNYPNTYTTLKMILKPLKFYTKF